MDSSCPDNLETQILSPCETPSPMPRSLLKDLDEQVTPPEKPILCRGEAKSTLEMDQPNPKVPKTSPPAALDVSEAPPSCKKVEALAALFHEDDQDFDVASFQADYIKLHEIFCASEFLVIE